MMNFQKTLFLLGVLIFLNNFSGGHATREGPFHLIGAAISSLGRILLSELYSESAKNENLLISPSSIYQALSLVHLGANGNSRKELSNILTIPTEENYTNSYIHSTIGSFYGFISKPTENKDAVIINFADALYVRDSLPVKNNYMDQIQEYYQTNVENVNFNAGKATINKINRWIADKTKDRIRELVDETLLAGTEALIVSCLYFEGRWAEIFPKDDTKIDKFFSGKKQIDVPMMNVLESFSYINNTDLQFEAINLPYLGSTYALNIILPYSTQTMKNVTLSLKDVNGGIKEMMKKSKKQKVDVKLPRVKFTKKTALVEPLQRLGIHELFTSAADLTGLSDKPLRVSQIFTGAEIEILEEGTAASSASVVQVSPGSALPDLNQNPISFHVNRPFIMNLYSRRFGTVLFTGIINDPVPNNYSN